MFSALTNLIWADNTEEQAKKNLDLYEEELDGEWILVDVDHPETDTSNSSMAAMEDSWLVTPPACFNAESTELLQLATSPIENLLIEHPSMSVYGRLSSPARRSQTPPQRLHLVPIREGCSKSLRSSSSKDVHQISKVDIIEQKKKRKKETKYWSKKSLNLRNKIVVSGRSCNKFRRY